MRLTFHGAARTVTGSQHLLEVNGHRVLLECGLYQGHRRDFYRINRTFPYDPRRLDAVLLSHAHIDHSGNLPNLVKQGYRGPIYATPATVHLANIMLLDSGHIHEADARYLNKKRRRRGEPPIEPLYTVEDAAAVADHFVPIPYDRAFEVVPGVTARFVEAGHILGSAAVVLDIQEQGRPPFRLWFSGDIGRRHLPILRDPVLPQHPTFLLMESTYGDKPHRDPRYARDELQAVVGATLRRGGRVVVPAFAVGRTQTLVYWLHRMMQEGDIPTAPIFVDSPLAVNASEIYRAHPECYDQEARRLLRAGGLEEVLGFGRVHYIRNVEASKALNDREGPLIIISASGMAETGRILHHLKHSIGDPRNTVLIVGWAAPHTLARRLAERQSRVRIFGEEYEVRAQIATIGDLSAHAGQDLLLEYALAGRDTLRAIFLVHGEPKGAEPLMALLRERGVTAVHYPARHEAVELP